jgi:hypothetical protein
MNRGWTCCAEAAGAAKAESRSHNIRDILIKKLFKIGFSGFPDFGEAGKTI